MRAEPIVAHPFEAPGQDMEEKPAEACGRVERHRALPMTPLVIVPLVGRRRF